MNVLLLSPIIIPLLAFAVTLLMAKYQSAQRVVSISLAFLYCLFAAKILISLDSSSVLLTQASGWPAPFGISLRIDLFSAALIAVTGVIYLAASLYASLGVTAENSKLYFPLSHALFLGISGAFVTADLFNLFVWFEITLLSSFVLMSLGTEKIRLSGAIKYVSLNLVSSLFFLISIGLIYGATHTLGFDSLKVQLSVLSESDLAYVNILAILIFCAFAIKSALFPFYTWLPASYHTMSPALSGVFAGLLTKLGLYAIFRVSTLLFPINEFFITLILIVAPLTMIFGVLGAIVQSNIRRILSFHIISQVGYIVLAAAFVSDSDPQIQAIGLASATFYMVHHILVKTNLFFVSGIIKRLTGTENLNNLGNLRECFPWLAILFVIPAMSLAGLPPTSGFWAKLALFKAAATTEYFFAILAMVIGGFFTLFSMIKIWNGAFWSEQKDSATGNLNGLKLPILACVLLSCFSLAIGMFPDYLMEKSLQAGEIATNFVRGDED